MTEDKDMISYSIIADAADARNEAMKAVSAAENGQFKEAGKLLESAERSFQKARQLQTGQLFEEMNGNPALMSLLTVHAQDHLMQAGVILPLAKKLVMVEEQTHCLAARVEQLEARLDKIDGLPEEEADCVKE